MRNEKEQQMHVIPRSQSDSAAFHVTTDGIVMKFWTQGPAEA